MTAIFMIYKLIHNTLNKIKNHYLPFPPSSPFLISQTLVT